MQKFRQERTNMTVELNEFDESKDDIYYMLAISCKHREAIGELTTKAGILKESLKAYDARWKQLKVDLAQKDALVAKPVEKIALKPKKSYVAVKGDKIDEMFAGALNASAYWELRVVRISEGKYLFGTKKITGKILNGRLVIRVGGGYTSVDEFI